MVVTLKYEAGQGPAIFTLVKRKQSIRTLWRVCTFPPVYAGNVGTGCIFCVSLWGDSAGRFGYQLRESSCLQLPECT